ncbi:MAG TPA: peptide-methionine (S)-S-oxide reductase MsrA [Candidatus Binataceae bacterium]|nr:peptide-methionine (S)-S-oxide reductase MsrA [Candidatus Binataceae bacterium]
MDMKNEIAVFGGGCFWCTEAVFEQVQGVVSVKSGFAGGTVPNPTYPQVCTGRTGHAEVARIEFEPSQISYRDLLEIFFATHDPTTLNRQGNDVGTEYRSIILYTSEEQRRAAEGCIAELTETRAFPDPIVTEVKPLEAFYPAEDYHHQYFRNNTFAPYCQFVIAPKLAKFRKYFGERLKA